MWCTIPFIVTEQRIRVKQKGNNSVTLNGQCFSHCRKGVHSIWVNSLNIDDDIDDMRLKYFNLQLDDFHAKKRVHKIRQMLKKLHCISRESVYF